MQVQNLSGGELQRVAITLALGTPADIYLIDEPSAYLDSEQRIIAAKVSSSSGSHTFLLRLLAWDFCVYSCVTGGSSPLSKPDPAFYRPSDLAQVVESMLELSMSWSCPGQVHCVRHAALVARC
jgi:hypothetical protein